MEFRDARQRLEASQPAVGLSWCAAPGARAGGATAAASSSLLVTFPNRIVALPVRARDATAPASPAP